MSDILDLFITRIYRTALNNYDTKINSDELEATCFSIAHDDVAGQNWCEENDYSGYTSYASLDDLPWRFPIFKDLVKAGIFMNDKNGVTAFARLIVTLNTKYPKWNTK